jgi:Eukaryotic cytochrome b561
MIIGFICSIFMFPTSGTFESAHSKWGLVTLIGVICSAGFGVWMRVLLPWLDEIYVSPAVWKLSHSLLGIVSYFLAFVTICLGISGSDSLGNSGFAIFLIILLTMTTTYVLIKPIALVIQKINDLNVV